MFLVFDLLFLFLVICLIIFLGSIFLIFLVTPVQAQVVINEVYPNPLSGEKEWVELFNSSEESIVLDNWTLEDKLSSPKVIYSFTDITFLSNQYYLASVSGQLNNSGDGVVLKNSLEEVVSQMDYSSSTQGVSWALSSDNNQYVLVTPTPLESNQIEPSPTPSISPTPLISPSPAPSLEPSPTPEVFVEDLKGKLELVSVMSCPDSSDEWFELKNTTDHALVSPLYLLDTQGNRFNFELDIIPGQKQRYYLSRHLLNNSGDTFTLIQEPDDIIFSYEISSCKKKNVEFVLDNGELIQADQLVNNIEEGQLTDEKQGQVLGLSSDENKSIVIEETGNKKDLFIVPLSYLSNLKLGVENDATDEAIANDIGAIVDDENKDNKQLLPVVLIIFGGIILSFLGIMYFYGKDWIKDKIMA